MNLSALLKLIHVFSAFWMTTGIIGRFVSLNKAEHSSDLHAIQSILPVAGVFERVMVIPGSLLVLLAGLVTAWAEGWPILGFIQGGTSNWVLASLLLYLTIMPVIRFVFLPRGKVFAAALSSAVAQGRVTSELGAAFRDPLVRAGHAYEFVVVVVIIALMVLKPF